VICVVLSAGHARAERGLITPKSAAPARLAPGELLAIEVEVATGLTPPPGIQEERAHRAFALALCADGLDLGAGARRCFALGIENLRPLDAVSLRYRVEARLPVWLAPSRYDLSLRYPGGAVEASGALRVVRSPREPLPVSLPVARTGETWTLAGTEQAEVARLHVGEWGVRVQGAPFEAFPLPDASEGLTRGFVALIQVPARARVFVTKRHEGPAPGLQIAAPRAEAGRSVSLRAVGPDDAARVFWWVGGARGGVGRTLTTRFLYPGKQRVQALSVSADGRVARAEATLPIWQRRAFGCSLQAGPGAWSELWCCVGLLVVSRSWKLRAARRRWRRGLC
jgi:hypothetical protein